MQVRDAKLLFDSGILVEAYVENVNNENCWSVRFVKINDDSPIHLQSKRSAHDTIRIFKSIHAACMAANKVGFKRITIVFNGHNIQ